MCVTCKTALSSSSLRIDFLLVPQCSSLVWNLVSTETRAWKTEESPKAQARLCARLRPTQTPIGYVVSRYLLLVYKRLSEWCISQTLLPATCSEVSWIYERKLLTFIMIYGICERLFCDVIIWRLCKWRRHTISFPSLLGLTIYSDQTKFKDDFNTVWTTYLRKNLPT